MALVLIQCPRTGHRISTGIEIDPDSFDLSQDGPKAAIARFVEKSTFGPSERPYLSIQIGGRTYRRSMTVSSRQWKILSEQRRRNARRIELCICEWNENGWGLPKGWRLIADLKRRHR